MKRKIKLFLGSGGGLLNFLFWSGPVLAADLNPPSGFTNLGNISFIDVVPSIIKILMFAALFVALIFMLIGGIRWITSGGDKAAAESARGTLTAAIIGLLIVLFTWAILGIIDALFGIDIVGGRICIPMLWAFGACAPGT